VAGCQGTVVARIHRLQHVQGLARALAHYNRSGRIRRALMTSSRIRIAPFPRRWADETPISPRDLTQLQFGGILDGNNALVVRNETRKTFKRVVLPEPVPPDTTIFSRA